MDIMRLANQYAEYMKKIKNDLHEHPELSYHEFRTTELIRKNCEKLDLEFIDTGLPTGIVAVMEGENPGRNIVIRADIDALPRKVPETGKYGNAFHGCGHDFHTAALLGAAKILHQQKFDGSITFIFQLAEEATSGARTLKEHHLFDILPYPIDMMFGFHNNTHMPTGTVGIREGAVMAAKTKFELKIFGKAAHSGEPHKGVDPIAASAAFIQSFQTITSRNVNPVNPIVCSICTIHGGIAENLIAEEVTMTGSIRALGDEVVEYAEDRMESMLRGICESYGCAYQLKKTAHNPSVYNSAEMTALARKAALKVTDAEHIIPQQPSLGSEDFAVLGYGIPYFFYMIGDGGTLGDAPGWHENDFHTDDNALPLAAAVLAQTALTALE
ncbi:MAG: amidohydrolase [Christensenellaceae bacterium]|nr:amidohydrolase [Christensenellaceae bacterium]